MLTLTAIVVVSTTSRGQSFEGTIHWDVTPQGGKVPTSGYTLQAKGSRSRVSIDNGVAIHTDILYIGDKDVMYAIREADGTYVMMTDVATKMMVAPKITKTSETMKILSYTCTKYVIETTDIGNNPISTNYWVTNEISNSNMEALMALRSARSAFLYQEIEGVPLKIETTTTEGTLIAECSELKKEDLPDAVFEVPAGYIKN